MRTPPPSSHQPGADRPGLDRPGADRPGLDRFGAIRSAAGRLAPTRFTLAHGAMAVAGLATFVTVGRALDDRDATVTVLSVAVDTPAGTSSGDIAVVAVAVEATSPFLSSYVEPGALPADFAVARPLVAGEPVMWTDLVPAGSPVLARTATIPVDSVVLSGLGLVVGDRVDVIAIGREGAGSYVIVDAPVSRLPTSATVDGLLAGPSESYVTIELSDHEALVLAVARRDGAVEIVRSTGAPALDPAYRTASTSSVGSGPVALPEPTVVVEGASS